MGKGGSAGIQTKKPETQVIKMATHTHFDKKRLFSHNSPSLKSKFLFISYSFLQTHLISIDFLFQLCLITAGMARDFA
jgi:hypothetical protein